MVRIDQLKIVPAHVTEEADLAFRTASALLGDHDHFEIDADKETILVVKKVNIGGGTAIEASSRQRVETGNVDDVPHPDPVTLVKRGRRGFLSHPPITNHDCGPLNRFESVVTDAVFAVAAGAQPRRGRLPTPGRQPRTA